MVDVGPRMVPRLNKRQWRLILFKKKFLGIADAALRNMQGWWQLHQYEPPRVVKNAPAVLSLIWRVVAVPVVVLLTHLVCKLLKESYALGVEDDEGP